ncbi:hypothetical protein ACWOAH_09465 [Vagococcus vulneris]|uniref:Uncharacterized protein n=1 Tax=Vagococcus vulneris TaxID=1977869 RepID=A0A429ZUN2_9ENTE|nr:hypothetical protein [Vagococcus vulneris]RST97359.1 hypothetical protein CBF37_09765 [Vagococcus vulneris]
MKKKLVIIGGLALFSGIGITTVHATTSISDVETSVQKSGTMMSENGYRQDRCVERREHHMNKKNHRRCGSERGYRQHMTESTEAVR